MKRRAKRAYDATSRLEEAQKTTSRIIEAASELLRKVRPENLSYADVAERSGIAVRTVYRHFPEPGDLLAAVARTIVARFAPNGIPTTRAELAAVTAAFHRTLSTQPALYRVVLAAPVRSGINMTELILTQYKDVLAELPAEQQRVIAGLLDLLGSPYAWEVLHTHWALPPEQITRACLAAAQLIADGFRRQPQLLDPAGPLPPMYRTKEEPSARRKKDKP